MAATGLPRNEKQSGKEGVKPRKLKLTPVVLSNEEKVIFLQNRHAQEIAELTDFTIGPGPPRRE